MVPIVNYRTISSAYTISLSYVIIVNDFIPKLESDRVT